MGTITIDVAAQLGQAPSQSGWIKIPLAYGATHVFTVANFTTETTPAFVALGALSSVKVTSLPNQGLLKLNSVAIVTNQVVTESDITAGNLVYDSNVISTAGYTDSGMTFVVSDTVSNLFYKTPQIAAISVDSNENKAPSNVGTGSELVKINVPLVITRAMLTTNLDGPYSDPEGDPADKLLISSIPAHGELKLDGVKVNSNDIIDFTDIDLGLLTYTTNSLPATGQTDLFDFKISDTGSGEFRG